MPKYLFLIVSLLILLTSCGPLREAKSAEETVERYRYKRERIEGKYVHKTINIDESRVITIFTGKVKGKAEIFATHSRKRPDGTWLVTDGTYIRGPGYTYRRNPTRTFDIGFAEKDLNIGEEYLIVDIGLEEHYIWLDVYGWVPD